MRRCRCDVRRWVWSGHTNLPRLPFHNLSFCESSGPILADLLLAPLERRSTSFTGLDAGANPTYVYRCVGLTELQLAMRW
jgi:hypothetical protein